MENSNIANKNIFDFGTQINNQTQAKNIQDLYKQPTNPLPNQLSALNFGNQSNFNPSYGFTNQLGPFSNQMSHMGNHMGSMGQVNFGKFSYFLDLKFVANPGNFVPQSGFGSQQFNSGIGGGFGGFNNQPFGPNIGFNQPPIQATTGKSSNIKESNIVQFSEQPLKQNINPIQKQSSQIDTFDDFQSAKSSVTNVN